MRYQYLLLCGLLCGSVFNHAVAEPIEVLPGQWEFSSTYEPRWRAAHPQNNESTPDFGVDSPSVSPVKTVCVPHHRIEPVTLLLDELVGMKNTYPDMLLQAGETADHTLLVLREPVNNRLRGDERLLSYTVRYGYQGKRHFYVRTEMETEYKDRIRNVASSLIFNYIAPQCPPDAPKI